MILNTHRKPRPMAARKNLRMAAAFIVNFALMSAFMPETSVPERIFVSATVVAGIAWYAVSRSRPNKPAD